MTDTFTGTAIVFGTSGFSAELLSANIPSASRGSIDTTHAGTTAARTFAPTDLIDWGDLEIELNFDPDEEPPLSGAAETITITWPLPAGGSTAATLAGSGFMTGFSISGTLEEKMTASATIKWTGDLTWTDAT